MVHRWQSLAGFVLAGLVLAGFSASPARTAAWTDYDRTLAGIRHELDTILWMESAKPGSGKTAVHKLGDSLPSSVSVTRDGQTIKADLRWIKNDLAEISKQTGKKRAEGIARVAERLDTMRTAAATASDGDPQQAVRARSILKNVLAASEYRPSLWDRIIQRIMMGIGDVLSKIHVSERTASVIAWVFIVICILAFVGVLVYLVLRLVNYQRKLDSTVHVHEKRPERGRRQSLESLLAAAESSAAERRYRDAFRYTYLATIHLLDKAKLITYADGITNWEYIRALKKQSLTDQANIFQSMTLLFDELVYGKREVSENDYLTSMSKFRHLEEMV